MTDTTKKSLESKAGTKMNEENFSEAPLKDKIGSSLKRIYDDVVNEPVPDDFLKLLEQADENLN